MGAKANAVEQCSKNKRKHDGRGPSQGSNDPKRFKDKCNNCGKNGYCAKDCRKPKNIKKQKSQINVTKMDKLLDHVSDLNLSAICIRRQSSW